jgi:hypothetical protein
VQRCARQRSIPRLRRQSRIFADDWSACWETGATASPLPEVREVSTCPPSTDQTAVVPARVPMRS